jgi:hypothetical protein
LRIERQASTSGKRIPAGWHLRKMDYGGSELTRFELNFWKMNDSGLELTENECRINYEFELMQIEPDKISM